jgi:hypothetical protein
MLRGPLTAVLLFLIWIPATDVSAADARSRDDTFRDQRSRTVESSLRDLSNRNEAALGSIKDTPQQHPGAFRGDRVDLTPSDIPSTASLVRDDIASSLHRLRRETVSSQTEDGRKARVNESLDRQTTEALGRAADSASSSRSLPSTPAPEFGPLRDERFDLRPDDTQPDPALVHSDVENVESGLHRLRRETPSDETTSPAAARDPN